MKNLIVAVMLIGAVAGCAERYQPGVKTFADATASASTAFRDRFTGIDTQLREIELRYWAENNVEVTATAACSSFTTPKPGECFLKPKNFADGSKPTSFEPPKTENLIKLMEVTAKYAAALTALTADSSADKEAQEAAFVSAGQTIGQLESLVSALAEDEVPSEDAGRLGSISEAFARAFSRVLAIQFDFERSKVLEEVVATADPVIQRSSNRLADAEAQGKIFALNLFHDDVVLSARTRTNEIAASSATVEKKIAAYRDFEQKLSDYNQLARSTVLFGKVAEAHTALRASIEAREDADVVAAQKFIEAIEGLVEAQEQLSDAVNQDAPIANAPTAGADGT
jgi:hypothetical protein